MTTKKTYNRRNGERDPESENQKVMNILFPKKEAKNMPADWHKWPEPQKSIYSRYIASKLTLVPRTAFKNTAKTLSKLATAFVDYLGISEVSKT